MEDEVLLEPEDVPAVVTSESLVTVLFSKLRGTAQVEPERAYDDLLRLTPRRTQLPDPPAIVTSDKAYLALYTELRCRLPSPDAATPAAWAAYASLFSLLLSGGVAFTVPHAWLWDIIDAFLTQLQHPARSGEWTADAVAAQLAALRDQSGILPAVRAARAAGGKQSGVLSAAQFSGYCAILGLQRLRCAQARYEDSLREIEEVDVRARGVYSRAFGVPVSLCYHLSFAYLSLGRYVDAKRPLMQLLTSVRRQLRYADGAVNRVYALLAVAVSLSPQRAMDDAITTTMRDLYGDRLARISRGDASAYAELYEQAAPQFLEKSVYEVQKREFMAEVEKQMRVPVLRSFLKLYTSIRSEKLAKVLKVNEAELVGLLEDYNQRCKQVVWSHGPPLSGNELFTSDVAIRQEGGVIYVTDPKVERDYAVIFRKHIVKLDGILEDLCKAQ